MTDSEFRASVRRDAIAAGMSAAAAEYLAEQVGKKGPKPGPTQHRAQCITMTSADRLQRMCSMFGAETLLPDIRRSGVSLRSVADMLTAATGTAPRIGQAGIGTVRVRLAQAEIGRRAA